MFWRIAAVMAATSFFLGGALSAETYDYSSLYKQVFGQIPDSDQVVESSLEFSINGYALGTITRHQAIFTGQLYIDYDEFLTLTQKRLSSDLLDQIATDVKENLLPLDHFEALGITSNVTAKTLALEVPQSALIDVVIPMTRRQKTSQFSRELKPATISGFFNFELNQFSVAQRDSESFSPLSVAVHHHSQFKDYGATVRGNFLSEHDHPWETSEAFIDRLWKSNWNHLKIGDVNGPTDGFLAGDRVVGLSLNKAFIGSPLAFSQSNFEWPLTLETHTKVSIYLNRYRIGSFDLVPGNYVFKEFPLIDGVNELRMILNTENKPQKTLTKRLIQDRFLQPKHSHRYHMAAGYRSETINRIRNISQQNPAVLLSHRYAPSTLITIGGDVHMENQWHLQDLSLSFGSTLGRLNMVLGQSQIRDQLGYGTQVQFTSYPSTDQRQLIKQSGLRFSANTADFNHQTLNPVKRELAIFAGIAPFRRFNNSIGVGVEESRNILGITRQYTFSQQGSFEVIRSLRAALQMRLKGAPSRITEETLLASLNFAPNNQFSMNAFYQLDNSDLEPRIWKIGAQISVFVDRFYHKSSIQMNTLTDQLTGSYALQLPEYGLDASVFVDMHPDVTALSGQIQFSDPYHQFGTKYFTNNNHDSYDLGYQNPRGNVHYFYRGRKDRFEETRRFRAETALVFADKHIALSRPIRGAFAILDPHPLLKDKTIVGNYNAYSDGAGKPVMSNIDLFREQQLKIEQIENIPIGFGSLPDAYVVTPYFQQGYILKIGENKRDFVKSYIYDESGDPYAYKLIMYASQGGIEAPIFTGESGEFELIGIKPGTLTLSFEMDAYPDIQVHIDEEALSEGRLDEIVLPALNKETTNETP